MKKSIAAISYIILIALTSQACLAQFNWYYDAEELITNVRLSSGFKIVPKSGDYSLKSITTNVSFFPRDRDNQDIIEISYDPEPKQKEPEAVFEWNNPESDSIDFSLSSKIRTRNRITKIQDRVRFPIQKVGKDLVEYLEPTEHIDITSGIISLATGMAEGEEDLFEIETRFANWISENIKYDLSSLTADVSQKSSWVLQNKQGVCDEITNLFISMNRAIGVPGRFVSGIAYTESPEFPQRWGGHGWAEIYFPNYGWVPFDITYNELGYVDPTHIIFSETADSEDSATSYEWLGRNVDIETKKLKVDAEVETSKGEVRESLSISARPLYDHVGFGSYNLISADIRNENDYYYAASPALSVSKDTEVIGQREINILLKPGSTKTVSWIIKVPSDLDSDYIYTFPIEIYTQRNTSAETSFKSEQGDRSIGYDELRLIKEGQTEQDKKKYSANIDFKCSFEKKEYDMFENAAGSCTMKNTGNLNLYGINACIEEKCRIVDLQINQEFKIESSIKLDEPGIFKFKSTLESDDISKMALMDVIVWDTPEIEIHDLKYPETVGFDDKYQIGFTISPKSMSVPKDSVIRITGDSISQVFDSGSIPEDRNIMINMNANELKKGKNDLKIVIEFYDRHNKVYKEETDISVSLENLTLVQNIKYFFTRIGKLFT